jgi:hypothetical protein
MIGIIGFFSDLFLAWLGTVLFPWKRRDRARSKKAGTAATPAAKLWPEAVEPVVTEAIVQDKPEIQARVAS